MKKIKKVPKISKKRVKRAKKLRKMTIQKTLDQKEVTSIASKSQEDFVLAQNGSGLRDDEPGTVDNINPQQRRFINFYVGDPLVFANGVRAYAKAYNIELNQFTYDTCKSNAHRLLTNAYILEEINKLLEKSGMNDEFMDKQLIWLATQQSDFKSKLGAVREYNRIKKRAKDEGDLPPSVVNINIIKPEKKKK